MALVHASVPTMKFPSAAALALLFSLSSAEYSARIFFFCGPLRAWWLMLKADYYLHWANGVLAFSSSLLPTPQKPHLVIGIYKLKILAIAPNCLLRKERGSVHSFLLLLLLLGTFTTTITTTTTARWGLMAMGEYSIWRKIFVC